MAAHTPGPWVTDPAAQHECVVAADGMLVADCAIFGSRVDEERPANFRQANARLIAAAPDLLRVIKLACQHVSSSDKSRSGGDSGDYLPTRDLMIAAIAKAEGR